MKKSVFLLTVFGQNAFIPAFRPLWNGKGNGLFENLELNRIPEAIRTSHISDTQEKRLMDKIKEYKDKGDDAWEYSSPCSAFAQDAWEAATGEYLEANSFIINNPTKLKESIIEANGGTSGVLTVEKNNSSTNNSIDRSSHCSGNSSNCSSIRPSSSF